MEKTRTGSSGAAGCFSICFSCQVLVRMLNSTQRSPRGHTRHTPSPQAPVGMSLFRRAALPSSAILAVSLAIGVASAAAFAAGELAPALRYLTARLDGGAPLRPLEDGFQMARFCRAHEMHAAAAGAGPH